MKTASHRSTEQMNHVTVAHNIREMLRDQRWTGRSAAVRLGWTHTYMSRRLNGEIPFDVQDLLAIAGLLEVEPGAFFLSPELQPSDYERAGSGRPERIATVVSLRSFRAVRSLRPASMPRLGDAS